MKTTLFPLLGKLLLFGAVLVTIGFQSSKTRLPKPVPSKVATALTAYFRKDFSPLKATQIETMNTTAFESWLGQSTLRPSQKEAIRQYLKPVLNSKTFEAIAIRKAKLIQGNVYQNIVLIRVPDLIKNQVRGADYVSIFANTEGGGTPVIETCQYNSCYCSSKNTPGSCTSTTQFNKNCPPNECAVAGGTCDCGGGGEGGTNLDIIFQTVFG